MKFVLGCSTSPSQKTGKRVAIVGAGVAGLGAAGYLYCRGYDLDVYDSMPEAGGLLMFGIPEERIPKKGVKDGIDELRTLGVRFHLGVRVEGELLREVVESHEATLLATGTWRARNLTVPGARLEGVLNGLDFLVTNSLWRLGYKDAHYSLSGKVGIVGGGYTAVDAATEALKWTTDVTVFYRRTLAETEAKSEWEIVKRNGVKIFERVLPTKILGSKRVEGAEISDVQMRGSTPVYVEGTSREVPLDYVIAAIGEERTPPGGLESLGVELKDGVLVLDSNMMTTREGVFAAGDLVSGPSFIGNALSSGLRAAKAIDSFLRSKGRGMAESVGVKIRLNCTS